MKFIDIAKEEAYIAMKEGEIPVGAVIVKNGEVIARAHNLKEQIHDPTAHAEMLAIKRACEVIGDWRLDGCDMYVTLEPCPMCASAILQSRIDRLYIGTFNKDMGACGSTINLLDSRRLNSFIYTNWLYDNECSEILEEFFRINRNKK
ncbi:nucleoside deaminase [Clostridium sp. SM-530-WT-3G]|uniref:deaminase n=1 Tax=Clostridium sp. SM-530-WT-3G TaxID=2725303 RepID=UPI00145FBD32|nr:nucleoside deaminase [Clostridium sp. SM-530-WT-3G]